MADLQGFNANHIEPTSEFEAIPAGKYLAMITDSETKPTKSGSGSYLQLTFQILDGEYKGRFLWARLNLNNPNATAVQIAKAELSATNRSTAAASAVGSSGGTRSPSTPSVTYSGIPPTRLAMTGRPQAMASHIVTPWVSARLGATKKP